MRRSSVAEIYEDLVNLLNRLPLEVGVEVESIRFSRSDVPVDWNDETNEWVVYP